MTPRTEFGIWRRLARGGSLALGLVGGCCWGHCWTCKEGGLKDPGTEPAPNGSYVSMWLEEHANRGELTDFTIFLNEWYMGGCDLGPFGVHHLTDIARRWSDVPYPVVIEPHLDTAVNEKRREIVINALIAQGIGDAEQRVVIAYPKQEGLYAEEGELIYYDMFFNRSGYFTGYGFGNIGRRGNGVWGNGTGFGGFGRFGGLGGGWGGGFGGGYGGYGAYGGYGGAGYGWGRGGGGYYGDGYGR